MMKNTAARRKNVINVMAAKIKIFKDRILRWKSGNSVNTHWFPLPDLNESIIYKNIGLFCYATI